METSDPLHVRQLSSSPSSSSSRHRSSATVLSPGPVRPAQHRRVRSLPSQLNVVRPDPEEEHPGATGSISGMPDTTSMSLYPPPRPSSPGRPPLDPGQDHNGNGDDQQQQQEEAPADDEVAGITMTPALQVRAHLFRRILSGLSNLGGDARLGLLVKFFFTVSQVGASFFLLYCCRNRRN
jgi:hypothetical protein